MAFLGFGKPNIEGLKSKNDIDGLVKALDYSKDQNIPLAATEALAKMGEQAIGPLCSALGHSNSHVRYYAAEALRITLDPRGVTPLIGVLADPDEDVRSAAAETLVEIGAPAVDSLINALKDPVVEVYQAAAKALVKIGPPSVGPLIAALKASALDYGWQKRHGYEPNKIAEMLGEIGDARAIEPLIEVLKIFKNLEQPDDSRPFDLRLETMGQYQYRSDPQYDARDAVEAIIRIDKSNAVQHLCSVIGTSSYWGRVAAAEALGELGDVNAVRPLCVAIKHSSNAQLREAAADALVKLVRPGDDQAVDPLIAAVRSSHCYVQVRAAKALGIIGDPRAIDPLTEALNGNDYDVEHAAAAALCQIKNTGNGTR